jgi:HSP20 family protein
MATNGKALLPARRQLFPELDEIRDVFTSFVDRPFAFPRLRSMMAESPLPAVDMFERDGNVIVKAEMPGIDPGKIEVNVAAGELRISGERKEETEVKEENFYRSERSYGHIYRKLTLPEGCDADAANATVKNGVLEVVIPKREAAVGKKIDVKTA